MTLGTLVITIAIVALILTALMGVFTKKIENWLVSYLQNFCGALFIFSGWVKAVDPLGTAYKMEQYFAEFEATFADTWFSFLAPMFPWLSEYAVGFSVFMIVFEIVLGVMLLIGVARKFTAWAFLLLVVFFTFLTGFTFLTAYVPEGVNFFEFGQWGAYVETNMKVTDCGCFGDFIKLKPRTSFFKDIFLLIPALVFVFAPRSMHQLLNAFGRGFITLLTIVGITIYCFSNYVWDIPHVDFRPFKEGRNLRLEKAMESLAEENIEVSAYRMTNKETGEAVELPLQEYLKVYKDYPKEEWDLEQVKSSPAITLIKTDGGYKIPSAEGTEYEEELAAYLSEKWALEGDTIQREIERSKVSDFEAVGPDGVDVTNDILSNSGYSFMVIAYKLKPREITTTTELIADTVYVQDTIAVEDTIKMVERIDRIDKKQVEKTAYSWKDDYTAPWAQKVNPVMVKAQAEGIRAFAITSFADPSKLESFRQATQMSYPFYTADDILLKTIVRSNPGVVLLKDGEVVKKWHHKKLPGYEEIKAEYME